MGFGLIQSRPLYGGGDWQDFLFAMTDGQRNAPLATRVSGTQIAVLNANNQDVADHLVERLHGRAEMIPNERDRFAEMLLGQPYNFFSTEG